MAPAPRGQMVRETAATTDLPQHNTVRSPSPTDHLPARHHPCELHRPSAAESLPMLRMRYPDTPPTFVIDLSLPPSHRYLHVCAAFRQEVRGLASLFDEVVGGLLYRVPQKWVHLVCRALLRRVHDQDEDEELKGISNATGVPMYLLVCFNVLLDLFMGCSSGGAAVEDEGGRGTKMLHFRTLDWGMPSLRKVVVQLEFQEQKDGPIVASSLTYAGYVGVLTGVKKGVSLSLNFRPHRNEKGQFWADSRYYWHLLMVLLGRRRSISSELRRFLLPGEKKRPFFLRSPVDEKWTYENMVGAMSGRTSRPRNTTACYLCFSNGTEAMVIEKDYRTAMSRTSRSFIVVTNTDEDRPDSTGSQESGDGSTQASIQKQKGSTGMKQLLEEAKDRQQCAEQNYQKLRGGEVVITEADVIELVQQYPTTNEETHFACVMDAQEGRITWCRRWEHPVGEGVGEGRSMGSRGRDGGACGWVVPEANRRTGGRTAERG